LFSQVGKLWRVFIATRREGFSQDMAGNRGLITRAPRFKLRVCTR
jgi:hypothetical protein